MASSSAQIFSPLHTFAAASGFAAPLMQGPDGTLYGVSSAGGLGGSGTVFRLNTDGTHFAVLYSFGKGTQFGAVYTNADGYGPVGGLVLSNNVLYGTTQYGGVTGYGTVFKINTDGSAFATLHFFTNGPSGGVLYAGLVLAGGALYGATYNGGTNSGTIFAMNTDGSGFTNLHNFGGTNGAFPMASMISSGSTLYGTTQEGNNGTVFKIDTSGANFAILHHFTSPFVGTNVDGDLPEASLLLSGNTLYGTASGGGRGEGTIFAVNTDGSNFTNLYNFTNGVDGASPVAALILSGNTLYGTTKSGGVFPGNGTIFSVNTDGSDFIS
ncbi:MAG TPA: choice-of-anchor tandem repeat GloVer-containing protein, partial [Candidatus Polarisedimenticolia bacterium]|nr:choice-of-anchor tandem repeat GloVer-containing protein [Candidatus Polarisedimenticolia bacterium]